MGIWKRKGIYFIRGHDEKREAFTGSCQLKQRFRAVKKIVKSCVPHNSMFSHDRYLSLVTNVRLSKVVD